MLEKVVILIQENNLPMLRGLADDLKEHGVEMMAQGYESEPQESTSEQMDADRRHAINCADRNVLYITDSEALYHILRQQGSYVLPYRHEGNADAVFAGALYVIEQIEEIGYEEADMAYRRLAGLPWDILTTERCIIRETTVDDVDSFYQIYAEPEITKYMEDLYADRDEEIAYVEQYRKNTYEFYGYGMWTVLTKEGVVIGRAGISWREGFDLPELGFMIGVPWQRQGYAYEICEAILAYAHEELGFTQIQALVMEGNEKSEALCRKLGFEQGESVELNDGRYEVFRYSVPCREIPAYSCSRRNCRSV